MIESVNLKPLRASTTEEIRAELEKATANSEQCDSVVIVMEKRGGGMLWYANDSGSLARINWLLDALKFHLLTLTTDK
jgi:hypothetical protein